MATILVATFAFARTPYSLILPGNAIDVRTVATIANHPPPPEHYYMTDVTLQEAVSPALLLGALLPGTRVVRTSEIVPHDVSLHDYDRLMVRAMNESQTISAYVAERAAGLPVAKLRSHVQIVRLDAHSHALKILHPGDIVRAVNGHPVATTIEIQNLLFKLKPGTPVRVTYERAEHNNTVTFPTMESAGKARLGVYLVAQIESPHLPVAVNFKKFDVSGSSGGMMFALDIYRSIHPNPAIPLERIAGTGTIDYDGTVGAIEGTKQKLIAAKKAGAQLFLVPKENYAEIAGTTGIKIIAVHTFGQALATILSKAPPREALRW